MKEITEKPDLCLVPGKGITAEDLAAMLKQITGKDMTQHELEECRMHLAAKLNKQ